MKKVNLEQKKLKKYSNKDIKKLIEYELPDGVYFNCGVTIDNYLVADTNDSSNFKTIKIPLPEGKWSIFRNPMGQKIILIKVDE